MIVLNAQSKVYVAVEAVDFRNGILGLKSKCRDFLKQNPESGVYFLFRNKKMTAIKILVYDGQGFWLMMKRLSKGKFPWWPEGLGRGVELDYKKLQLIINVAFESSFSEDWKRLF
jgi:transposase